MPTTTQNVAIEDMMEAVEAMSSRELLAECDRLGRNEPDVHKFMIAMWARLTHEQEASTSTDERIRTAEDQADEASSDTDYYHGRDDGHGSTSISATFGTLSTEYRRGFFETAAETLDGLSLALLARNDWYGV